MITQEQYLKLENQIRKDLPRLLEPTEGCYLKNHVSEKMYKISGTEGGMCFLQDIKNLSLSSLEITQDDALSHFKIIGHDIMLNDVLEWLGKIDFGFMLETDGTLIQKTSYFDREKKKFLLE